jgi:shikimate dehydrogenase
MSHKIPVVAVIGSPIAHSKSPKMHGYWLAQNDIAGHYVPLDVAPDHLETVLRTLPKMGFVGANITIPHKEAALKFADYVSDRAAKIGAANTLFFDADGKIHADNTDGHGFIENLRAGCPTWSPTDGNAMVLGAGGASRAIIVRCWNRARHRSFWPTAPARVLMIWRLNLVMIVFVLLIGLLRMMLCQMSKHW